MYKIISSIVCVKKVETNETIERDLDIIAVRPHNCEDISRLC